MTDSKTDKDRLTDHDASAVKVAMTAVMNVRYSMSQRGASDDKLTELDLIVSDLGRLLSPSGT